LARILATNCCAWLSRVNHVRLTRLFECSAASLRVQRCARTLTLMAEGGRLCGCERPACTPDASAPDGRAWVLSRSVCYWSTARARRECDMSFAITVDNRLRVRRTFARSPCVRHMRECSLPRLACVLWARCLSHTKVGSQPDDFVARQICANLQRMTARECRVFPTCDERTLLWLRDQGRRKLRNCCA
jgi:hypothetical protein